MPYQLMTPVSALDIVASAELNKIKNNVDIRTGLYRYHHFDTVAYSTTSTTHVAISVADMQVTLPTIEEQNILVVFTGSHNGTSALSRFGIHVDGALKSEIYANVGVYKINPLAWIIENTTGGELIDIRFKNDGANTLQMVSSSFSVIGL